MWAFYASWNNLATTPQLPKQGEITLAWKTIEGTSDELLAVIKMVAESNIEWEQLWTFINDFLHFKNSQSLILGNAVDLYRKQIMDAFHDADDVPYLMD